MTDAERRDLVRRFLRDWGIQLDVDLVVPTVPRLTREHEADIMAEYGALVLIRYYCPGDTRVTESA